MFQCKWWVTFRCNLTTLSYAEFRAKAGKPLEAYFRLEKRLKSPEHSKELIREIQKLLQKYPEVLQSAKLSFTLEAFEEAVDEHGEEAEKLELERLEIYQKLARPDAYEDAKREFADYFSTLRREEYK